MGKFNNNQNNRYNNKRTNKNENGEKARKFNKPVMRTIPFTPPETDCHGNEYDMNSLYEVMDQLQDAGVFSMLSVMATMPKRICLNDENAKGVMSVARISSYNKETNEISVTFYSKNIEFANLIDNMIMVPRVRTGRDTDNVSTILGFEITNGIELATDEETKEETKEE